MSGVTRALPEEVAGALARDLAAGPLRPGDRLPTEQMLAARFSVSRAVVRAAIARAHEAMAAAPDWDGAGVAADIGFHRAVAEATGNARFTGFIAFLGDS